MRLEEVPPVRSLLEETLDRELAEERSAGRKEGIERGIEQGIERGIERGRTEGREEGRTEGRAEGRTEGRAEGRTEGREEGRAEERELLLAQAALKFGRDAVRGLAEPLRALATPDTIRQAGLCIVECASAAEMLARMRQLADAGGDRASPG